VLATVAEDFGEQFGGAVGDEMLLVERRGAVHQHEQLDDAPDRIEVAGRCFKSSQQIDGDPARGLFAVRRGEIRAELPGPGLAILLRDMTGDEDQIPAAQERHKGCDRGRNARERDGQGLELLVNGHAFSSLSAAGTRSPWLGGSEIRL
jgi:hypothetical protein